MSADVSGSEDEGGRQALLSIQVREVVKTPQISYGQAERKG